MLPQTSAVTVLDIVQWNVFNLTQIITTAPQQPQMVATAQPPFNLPIIQPPAVHPTYMEVELNGQRLLVQMENPQPLAQWPLQTQLQPQLIFPVPQLDGTYGVLPAPTQLSTAAPVVLQQPGAPQVCSGVTHSSRHFEAAKAKGGAPVVIDLVDESDDEDDPAAAAAAADLASASEKGSALEIAMREITGLEVKVEVGESVTVPPARPSARSKSDMGTNTELGPKSTKLPQPQAKGPECQKSSNVDVPQNTSQPEERERSKSAKLDQVASTSAPRELTETTVEEKSAGGGALKDEDDDDDKGSFKGEDIVDDKSADLKRVGDDDDHHLKSSPKGTLKIATGGNAESASAQKEEGGGEEFRCERCGKVYMYINFLKVHLRRCGGPAQR